MNIIIVDDDALVSASLKTILEADRDITVQGIGKNGHDAISLYFKHQPAVALMDIQMPEMNGLEAAREILRREPKARILFLTTFSDDDYIIQALSIGAKGYCIKTAGAAPWK